MGCPVQSKTCTLYPLNNLCKHSANPIINVGHKLNPPLLVDMSKREKVCVWGRGGEARGGEGGYDSVTRGIICATEFMS